MTSTCRCGRPTRDANYVCDDCATRLSQALGDIPWLAEELDTSSTRAKGVDYRTKGGTRSTEKPLPFNNAITQARTELKAVLVSWVVFCRDEHVRNQSPSQATPADTLEAISRYLL